MGTECKIAKNDFDRHIEHRLLKEATEKRLQAISTGKSSPLIMVYGPSGVGKTTMKKKIIEMVIKRQQREMEADPGHIPIGSIEMSVPEIGKFDWRDYYLPVLSELQDPVLNRPVAMFQQELFGPWRVADIDDRRKIRELRRTTINSLKNRKTLAVIIDEAQHLTQIASGRKLQQQLDYIKSIVNMTGVPHILIGTYQLLPFRNLSEQLSNRSLDIHFRRYQASGEEKNDFLDVLKTFQSMLPIKADFEFVHEWEFFYERTLGCVGNVKRLLEKALHDPDALQSQTLRLKHLKASSPKFAQCVKMADEIISYEADLLQEGDWEEHRRKIGLVAFSSRTARMQRTNNRGRKSVGERNPNRDAV